MSDEDKLREVGQERTKRIIDAFEEYRNEAYELLSRSPLKNTPYFLETLRTIASSVIPEQYEWAIVPVGGYNNTIVMIGYTPTLEEALSPEDFNTFVEIETVPEKSKCH